MVNKRGIVKKLLATSGVVVFGAAAASMFAISLVSANRVNRRHAKRT